MSELQDLFATSEQLYLRYEGKVRDALIHAQIIDVNSTQAVLLHRLGSESMTIGQLITFAIYTGTNTSYNVKKLIDSGYVTKTTNKADKRSQLIRATEKAAPVQALVEGVLGRLESKIYSFSGMSKVSEALAQVRSVLSMVLA